MFNEPVIVQVRFVPSQFNQYVAQATFEDGLVEKIFEFDPRIASFSPQELIGLTKKEARLIKDNKTDQGIGIEQPI